MTIQDDEDEEDEEEARIRALVFGQGENSLLRSFGCLLYTSPSPRDKRQSRMPSSA